MRRVPLVLRVEKVLPLCADGVAVFMIWPFCILFFSVQISFIRIRPTLPCPDDIVELRRLRLREALGLLPLGHDVVSSFLGKC